MAIPITVKGQKMRIATNQIHCIKNSKNFVKFKFDLDNSWKNFVICAVFEQDNVQYFSEINNGYAFLPEEIQSGLCDVALFGLCGSITATTNRVHLIINDDISTYTN